jgi:hypothetical protein
MSRDEVEKNNKKIKHKKKQSQEWKLNWIKN